MNLKRFSNKLGSFGFIAPAIILIFIFWFVPILITGYISLFKFPLVNLVMRVFVGLKNYFNLFQDTNLRKAFINILSDAVLLVPSQTILALVMPLLVEKPIRAGLVFLRSTFYIPVVISTGLF